MNIIDIVRLIPAGWKSAKFEGEEHGASVSFFIVNSAPGTGPEAHRHPYEEIFIILEGAIEADVDGKKETIQSGNVVIIPPNTWHGFKNISDHTVRMVNIHPSPKMIQENRN
ncbi:MAG: cupin domain-containing protein [Ignavibacteriaceae bacterium]